MLSEGVSPINGRSHGRCASSLLRMAALTEGGEFTAQSSEDRDWRRENGVRIKKPPGEMLATG